MITKTYKMTIPCHNHSFVLQGKSGIKLRYNFEGGNTLTGTPARLMLRGEYAQGLLEESDYFKKGVVVLERKDDSDAPVVVKRSENVREDINSPEKLIEFVATELEKSYQKPQAALSYAQKQGYVFPNLTLE